MLCYLTLLEFVEETHKQQFQALYQANEKKMYAVAMSYLHDHHKAEDAVSASFLKIIAHFEKIISLSCTKQTAYIVIIVKNISLDLLRESRRLVQLDEAPPLLPTEAGPEELDGYHQLLDFLTQLPPMYRTPLELTLVLEWSPAETAQLLKINENTLRARLRRGRALLRQNIEEGGYYFDK